MRGDPPPRLAEAGLGEIPPTSGLPPRWRDLLATSKSDPFENALCTSLGLPDVEVVSTGTAALLIAFTTLKAMHPDRDTVIVPGYTCPLVVLAAAAAGLKAIACDTVPGGFDLAPTQLVSLVNATTLAIVPTHYGGVLTDVDAVRRTAATLSPPVAIVEDAAQALGATWHGASVGLSGDIGVFSLGAGKGLTIYEGGLLTARDPAVMNALRQTAARLTRYSMLREIGRAAMFTGYHIAYTPLGLRLVYGRPKRTALVHGDDIEAAGDRFPPGIAVDHVGAWRKRVGRAALARLDRHLIASRSRFDELATRLSSIPGLTVHTQQAHARPSATALFVTLAPHPERDNLIAALWRSRLGVSRMFTRAIGDYPDIAPLLLPSETPNARALAAGTVTISTSQHLSPRAQDIIVETFQGYAHDAGWN